MALKIIAIRPKTALLRLFNYSNVPFRTSTMKKYICILASAALLAACEQKTETTEPAATPAPTTPPAAATGVSSPAAAESPATTTESPAATTESPAQSPPSQ
jgi:ABC-type uncharacterized transport system auxiliary subunit